MLQIGVSHSVKTQFSVSINDLEMCMCSRNPEKLVKHRNENLLIKKIQPRWDAVLPGTGAECSKSRSLAVHNTDTSLFFIFYAINSFQTLATHAVGVQQSCKISSIYLQDFQIKTWRVVKFDLLLFSANLTALPQFNLVSNKRFEMFFLYLPEPTTSLSSASLWWYPEDLVQLILQEMESFPLNSIKAGL